MELKNAIAVGLISLFSATIVVLIARALDDRAAARLEPHLARIVEELAAIRTSGGLETAPDKQHADARLRDGLMVYYLHGERCPTCRAAEQNAHAALRSAYAEQIQHGDIRWEVLDYTRDPAAQRMAERFEVISPVVVLVRLQDGKVQQWTRLDRTLALAEDAAAMSDYLQQEIARMLSRANGEPTALRDRNPPAVPSAF